MGGRGKGKVLSAENLHDPGQAKMLSLGQAMSGEFWVWHGWATRREVNSGCPDSRAGPALS